MTQGCARLIERLDAAVVLDGSQDVTARIKQALQDLAGEPPPVLPDALTAVRAGCYARRLLHRDPRTGYTVVVMTWGPGQRTQLHDHAGMWCVECVVEGRMTVEQYDLLDQRDERFRFDRRQIVRAAVGDAGCLIPPFEHHVLGNADEERKAVSLHVYAGEMDHCHVYLPDGNGWWTRESKRLDYHDQAS